MLPLTILRPSSPIVSYAKHDYLNSFGVFGRYADVVADLPGIFLISLSWTLEDGGADGFAREYHSIAEKFPHARIIVAANTDGEVSLMRTRNVPALRFSATLLVDDRVFRVPDLDAGANSRFRTLLNARFSLFKRHELAVKVKHLGLIYTKFGLHDGEFEQNERRIRELLPNAAYLNVTDGGYHNLTNTEVAALTGQARSALVLSAVEGNCRASMEALMCGVPVISTPSIGGRDRFYNPAYSIIARPDPDSIAAANDELLSRHLDPHAVRKQVMAQVWAERATFLDALNQEIERFCPGAPGMTDFRILNEVNPWVPARDNPEGQRLAELFAGAAKICRAQR